MCAQRILRSAWAYAQSDQSSQCALWVVEDPMFLHPDSEDSDQTGRTPRLIWVFAGRTYHFVGCLMRRLILNFHRYFTDPGLLDRVPTCFLILGACYLGMQLIGIAMLTTPPSRGTTSEVWFEPRHEKTWLCHMRTTKTQISLRLRAVWSARLLFANTSSFYIRNFKPLPSFSGCAGRFVSYLVANPEDRFSHDEAHLTTGPFCAIGQEYTVNLFIFAFIDFRIL